MELLKGHEDMRDFSDWCNDRGSAAPNSKDIQWDMTSSFQQGYWTN